jgi:uracil phosphoribosyltransferase
MQIINLGAQNSIFNQFIAELRDESIQKDSLRFRRNLERIGEIMAYEISKQLHYSDYTVTTPLGECNIPLVQQFPVVATILRAGLPLHTGFLNYFDKADSAFISAYRKHHKDGTFEIELEYVASPDLTDRILILCDPMLATGASIVLTYKALMRRGKPLKTFIVSAIASAEGIQYVKNHLRDNEVNIYTGAIDDELTAKAYIVPGLGDAGDLAFGAKD